MNFSDIANMYQAAATAQIANVLSEQQQMEHNRQRQSALLKRREKELRDLPSVEAFERENGFNMDDAWLDGVYHDFDDEFEKLQCRPEQIKAEGQSFNTARIFKMVGYFVLAVIVPLVVSMIIAAVTNSGMIGALFALAACCGFVIKATTLPRYDTQGKLDEWELACEDLIIELCAANILLFAKKFDKTPQQIQYELTGLLMSYPDQKNDWWLNRQTSKVIEEELQNRLALKSNGIKQSSLKVRNLQLQNEGIAIDNVQKKFWRCVSCGNLNRADDMQCPSCGGIRRMEEE